MSKWLFCTHLDRWIPKQVWKIPSLKLTAKAPEKWWLEDFLVSFLGTPYFQRLPRSFRGCIFFISSLRLFDWRLMYSISKWAVKWGSGWMHSGNAFGELHTLCHLYTEFSGVLAKRVAGWCRAGRRHGECSWVGSSWNQNEKNKQWDRRDW